MRKTRDKFKKKRLSKRPIFRKKECKFCVEKIAFVDHKDVSLLQKFMTERGKIVSSRISGNCAKHQRKVANAIKRARMIGLLPFVAI
ncbi:MAG: 30S ribosomal protein S18 [Candidatus Omnitrophica bacterium]|nr:30S ribosomal protein S18 [Candidatus Omnitrophota bacterium]